MTASLLRPLVGILGLWTGRMRRRAQQAGPAGDTERDRCRQLIDNIPNPVWLADTKGRCTHFNRAWLELTGRALDQELVKGWLESIHPDDREHTKSRCEAALANRAPFVAEYRVRCADGDWHWIADHGVPVYLSDGEFAGFVGSSFDIQAGRDAAAQIARLRDLYAALSHTTRAVSRAISQTSLFREVTRIVVDHTPFPMAWIGEPQPESGNVRPLAVAGQEAEALEAVTAMAAPDRPEDEGVVGRAFRERRTILWRNLSQETAVPVSQAAARQAGFQALAATPIVAEGAPVAVLVVYAPTAEYFGKEALALLDEVAAELGFGVASLRRERQRRRAEAELQLSAEALANTMDAVFMTDAANRIVFVNAAFTEITGYPASEVLGRDPAMLASGRHERTFFKDMWRDLSATGAWQGELWNRRRDGEIYPQWLRISAVRDGNGSVSHYVATASDLTARKAIEAKVHHLSDHDGLTGLPNRDLLHRRLEQALHDARRYGEALAVLLVDLDRFRLVNDSHGYRAGDTILRRAGDRLSQLAKDEGVVVSRPGADQFIVVVPGTHGTADLAHQAGRILALLDEPYEIHGERVHSTASIGISVFPDDGTEAGILVNKAESAVRQAKAMGRNTYQFFTDDMNVGAAEVLTVENDLRRALAEGQLTLYYQAQVAAESGTVTGAEALLRWHHPERGIIPPERFIHIAEDAGLIIPIGRWVLETACREVRHWQRAGLFAGTMAINLSALEFRRPELTDNLQEILARTGLAPRHLELELTERVVMTDLGGALKTAQRLRAMGLRLALDDFGTGFCNLAYLKRFQVDKLKIDRSFVGELASNPADSAISETIIHLGHNLGLTVVAEGIEAAEQIRHLREGRCDAFQGFLINPPMSGAEFEGFLRHRQQAAPGPLGAWEPI